MAQRAALAVSAAVTAFILILALGVSSVIGQGGATPGATTAAVQPVAATGTSAPDAATIADTGASASLDAGLNAGPISQSQAAAIARTYLGGGTVARVDLSNVDGIAVYVVTFADGQAVYEDATSGRVVSWTGSFSGMTSSTGNSVASGERQPSRSSRERRGEDHDD